MLLFPESAGCNMSQAFSNKMHPVGHAASLVVGKSQAFSNKVHPARHAAGLLVGETLAGYDPHS